MEVFPVSRPGDVGVVYQDDQLPFDIPPNGWSYAMNIRFLNGNVEASRGWLQRASLPNICKHLSHNTGTAGSYWLAFGPAKAFTVGEDLAIEEITRVGGYTSGAWHLHNFQGVPIATNDTEVPQAQFLAGTPPDVDTLMVDMPFWPATDTCALLVGYKNFIVALNITEDGDHFPLKIRWSDAADPGSLPGSWDVTDPATLAGERLISGEGGPILAAEVLGEDLIIYTATGSWRLTYVGGPYVMRLARIPNGIGAYGPYSVVAAEDVHFIVTKDDLVSFDGNSHKSLIDGRGRQLLAKALTVGERGSMRMAYYSAFKEIWLGLTQTATVGNFSALNTVHLPTGAISRRYAPSLVDMKEMTAREPYDTSALGSLTWDQIAQTPDIDGWDKIGPYTWDTTAFEGGSDDYRMIGLGKDGDLYLMDYGYEFSPFSEYESILEKTDLNITGDENTAVVLSVYPRLSSAQIPETPAIRTWDDIEAKGSKWDGSDGGSPDYSSFAWNDLYDNRNPPQVFVGTQQRAGDVVNWRQGKDLVDLRKATTKARGVRHAIRIRSQGVPWRLSGYDLEYVKSGRR